jgi:DNA-binding MarR family transcriptional regulator
VISPSTNPPRVGDLADRRAKRIYLTGRGRQAADAGYVATRHAEEHIQAALGPRQYQQLRRNLAAIAHLDL